MQKLCSNCSEPAQFSVIIIVSSVGVSPRVQKASPAVLFCNDCLREFSERLCSDDMQNAVNNAYTNAAERLDASKEQSDGARE